MRAIALRRAFCREQKQEQVQEEQEEQVQEEQAFDQRLHSRAQHGQRLLAAVGVDQSYSKQ